MEALITRTDGLMFVILLMVAFSLWLQRYKVFKSLGPVLTVVVLGIVLSNTRVVPISHDVYGTLSTYCVPLVDLNLLIEYELNRAEKIKQGTSSCFNFCNWFSMYYCYCIRFVLCSPD